jgi:hypothetical protein
METFQLGVRYGFKRIETELEGGKKIFMECANKSKALNLLVFRSSPSL